MITCGVYTITCVITGATYVGQAINVAARWNKHESLLRRGKHHNVHLQRAWNKYGPSSFAWQILRECAAQDLTQTEQASVNELKARGTSVYNHGLCVDNAWRGVKRGAPSAAHLAKLRGRAGAKHHFFGTKFSEAHCRKISVALTGKPSPTRGEAVSTNVLSEAQVVEIIARHWNGATQRPLGLEYGVEWTTIGRIVRGENWKHIPRPIGSRCRPKKVLARMQDLCQDKKMRSKI